MLIRSVRHRRWLIARTTAGAVVAGGVATAAAAGVQVNPFGASRVVPQAAGACVAADEPVIAPYGQRTQFTDQPIGSAVGSDGARVAVQTGGLKFHKPSFKIVDAANGAVAQSFGSTGVAAPTYSADGSALYAITGISTQTGGTNSIVTYAVGLITNPITPERSRSVSPISRSASRCARTTPSSM